MKKGIAPRESKVSVFKISFGPSYRTRVISALFSVGKRRETSDGLKEKRQQPYICASNHTKEDNISLRPHTPEKTHLYPSVLTSSKSSQTKVPELIPIQNESKHSKQILIIFPRPKHPQKSKVFRNTF